jgi:catechol 2,3-dioxygenase-like lactoylglutathione lyase family enzyme
VPAGLRILGFVAQRVQVAIDCHDPDRLAAFWAAILGYELMEPPDGSSSWAEHSRAQAEEPGEGWIKVVDPDRGGPTVLFHRVREAKVVKNRVHLDVRAPDEGTGSRRQQVDTFVARVVELGASKVREVTDDAGYFAVMQDPEGNEFCIGGGGPNPA